MPQFDHLTFSSQLFWFCLIFSVFFLTLNYIFFPFLSLFVKVSQKKIKTHLNFLLKQLLNFLLAISEFLFSSKNSNEFKLFKSLIFSVVWFFNIKEIKTFEFQNNNIELKHNILVNKLTLQRK